MIHTCFICGTSLFKAYIAVSMVKASDHLYEKFSSDFIVYFVIGRKDLSMSYIYRKLDSFHVNYQPMFGYTP